MEQLEGETEFSFLWSFPLMSHVFLNASVHFEMHLLPFESVKRLLGNISVYGHMHQMLNQQAMGVTSEAETSLYPILSGNNPTFGFK